jgi:hypothetical protein
MKQRIWRKRGRRIRFRRRKIGKAGRNWRMDNTKIRKINLPSIS